MRNQVYVLGLIGLLASACAQTPATRTSAAESGPTFAELVRIGRAVPGAEMADRVSGAPVRFHAASVKTDVSRDGQIAWAIFNTAKMPSVAKTNLEKAALTFVKE